MFRRLGVTPDGSGVVFEVTNEFQLIGQRPLAEERQGFFYVRADGSGLRRLGPPSRDPTYRIYRTPLGHPSANFHTYLPFSPSGCLVAYTDVGPAPDGSDATQIFTLDVVTGQRTQVTQLPQRTPATPEVRTVGEPYSSTREQSGSRPTRGRKA